MRHVVVLVLLQLDRHVYVVCVCDDPDNAEYTTTDTSAHFNFTAGTEPAVDSVAPPDAVIPVGEQVRVVDNGSVCVVDVLRVDVSAHLCR
jgi:hypothetical protein